MQEEWYAGCAGAEVKDSKICGGLIVWLGGLAGDEGGEV